MSYIHMCNHFEFILVYGVKEWSDCFTYNSPVFPASLEETVFGPFIFLPPSPWIDRMHVGLFLGSLFCSTDIHVCFYYSTTLLITAALQPEVWEGTTSSFVFCVSI